MSNKEIIILTDYKNVFGSKHFDSPYRSGLQKDVMNKYFGEYGYSVEYLMFSKLKINNNVAGKIILYTSSEDAGYYYKSYIEDVILGCEINGAIMIPGYKYLRANNNKVFMEILRDSCSNKGIKNIKSDYFGSLEEVLEKEDIRNSKFPKVLKLAEGASGDNVELADSYDDLLNKIKRICRTKNISEDLWDLGRSLKHNDYKRESLYRKKFIVQEFIPGLINDWKIYVYYDSYFIFYRPILKKGKFKASGGGYDNYSYGVNAKIPDGILDYAESIRNEFKVPQLSLDIAFDGKQFYLIEFQFLYFGTAGIPYSDEYFVKEGNNWEVKANPKDQEYFYVDSICKFIDNDLNV